MSMNFTFALSSIGFWGRFIIAFIILGYLYSNNKSDKYLRKGFKTLCITGAVFFALTVLGLLLFFTVGGISLLNNSSFVYHFPF